MEKIDKETNNGAFEMMFRDGNWGLNPEQVLPIFKALIKRHNELVDLVNELTIPVVDSQRELLVCDDCLSDEMDKTLRAENKCVSCGEKLAN